MRKVENIRDIVNEKLANALGVDLNTLVEIGTIQRMSNEDMVIRIAKALDVDILG